MKFPALLLLWISLLKLPRPLILLHGNKSEQSLIWGKKKKSLIWCYLLLNSSQQFSILHRKRSKRSCLWHITSDLSSLDPKSSIFHILPLFLQLCFSPREFLLQSLQCLTVSQDIMLYYLYFSEHAVSFLCNIFSFFLYLEQFCSPLKTWLSYQPSVLSRATRHSTS